jgi:hypothetical protein
MEALLCSKNIKFLHGARSEYSEQLSQLGLLQILTRMHGINSETEVNLNFL